MIRKRRFFALFTAAAMLCMLLSLSALAEGSPAATPEIETEALESALAARSAGDVCQILDTDGITVLAGYSDFADSLADVNDGQTIQLLESINYDGGVVITGKTVIFDVNGFTLEIWNKSGHGLEVGAGGISLLVDSVGGGELNTFSGVSSGGKDLHGVYAHDGGKAEVTNTRSNAGGIGARGANAVGPGSEITVYGDVIFGAFYGLGASGGSTITVYGNVNGGGGMSVRDPGTTITVYGNSSGGGTGIFASNGVTVYVKGNVIGGGAGVYANSGAQVTVDGYVRAQTGGKVYIHVGGVDKMQPDYEPTSSKESYFEYKNDTSNVWVKFFNPPLIYTVTFDTNGGVFADDSTIMEKKVELPVTAVGAANMPDDPVLTDWVFAGWNTGQDGSGDYFDGETTVRGDMTVYAQWEEPEEEAGGEDPGDEVEEPEEGGEDPEGGVEVPGGEDDEPEDGDEEPGGGGGENPGGEGDDDGGDADDEDNDDGGDADDEDNDDDDGENTDDNDDNDGGNPGGGGGGNLMPPSPANPDHPLIQDGPDSYIELDLTGAPLGTWHWDGDNWIFEEFPPLGNLPDTGDNGLPAILLLLLGFLLLGTGLTLKT